MTNSNTTLDDDSTLPRIATPAQARVEPYSEPSYREHVSGTLAVHPSDAPRFRPANPTHPSYYQQLPPRPVAATPYPAQPQYPGYPAYPVAYPQGNNGYPGYNGHAQQYPGYPAYPGYYGYAPYGYSYPYPWPPARPKRDGYLLGVSITGFIGAILAILGGLFSGFILLLFTALPTVSTMTDGQRFGGIVIYIAITVAGLAGGGFCLYHSMRSLFFKKPSAQLKLPWFWLFLGLYLLVLITAIALNLRGLAVSNVPTTIFLIALAGLLPAATILALGLRRLHYPRQAPWPTNWRRFTLALVSGTTLAILLATILELILTAMVTLTLGPGVNLADPNLATPHDPRLIAILLLIVSLIAPAVEEFVKPLAVVVLIGRVRSAAEAFILGMACGIGFDLIETAGYISQGYRDWLNVAIERSSAGLLHGFGAGMVALGWYYLTHRDSARHRILLGLGCGLYAVLQHATWNGSFVLGLLPDPVGSFLSNGSLDLPGGIHLDAILLVYLVETILMLVFFLFVTGKLRGKQSPLKPAQAAEISQMPQVRDPMAMRV